MRRFLLERLDSQSVSGEGFVAEGVQFTNGMIALTWRTMNHAPLAIGDWSSVAVYPSLARCKEVHGHGGKTLFRFLDEKDPPHELDCPTIVCQVGCNCGMGLKPTPGGARDDQ